MAGCGYYRWGFIQRDGTLIFATVGSQMPFDRLIQALDEWAGIQGGVVKRAGTDWE